MNTATQLPPSAMSGQVSLDLRETDAYALNMSSKSMRGPLPPRRCFVFPFSHESGLYYPLMLSLPVSGASPSCLPSQGPRPLGGARGLLTTQPRTDCFGARKRALTEERRPKSNDAKWETFGPYFPTCRSSSLP